VRTRFGACRQCARELEQAKRRLNRQFIVRQACRKRVREALALYGAGKTRTSIEYGIDYIAIAAHLGDCPGPRAEYHIDHIRPLVSFDLTRPEQIREAFAPANHQWLPAQENLRKGARVA
jgi:hypothetical protein